MHLLGFSSPGLHLSWCRPPDPRFVRCSKELLAETRTHRQNHKWVRHIKKITTSVTDCYHISRPATYFFQEYFNKGLGTLCLHVVIPVFQWSLTQSAHIRVRKTILVKLKWWSRNGHAYLAFHRAVNSRGLTLTSKSWSASFYPSPSFLPYRSWRDRH